MLKSIILATFVAISHSKRSSSADVCPGYEEGTPPSNQASNPDLEDYNDAVAELDIEDVMDDIKDILCDSQDCWPADSFGSESSYGPLFIRLAWHCSGTFRITDGKGGCTGGRQRFTPEANMEDNTNLDKARALLAPIKQKYGDALSWGDLFIAAGNTAILSMGGPIKQMCVGRIDDEDGTNSQELGGGDNQPPCDTDGDCDEPLGSSSPALIYVNPEGFMGDPDPEKSAAEIREIFARMGFNDRETVALIGGGHAFGKCHGACPAGPGSFEDGWPGECGSGKGEDTYTSGLEGQWTETPLEWDNLFFKHLSEDEYELYKGPGDKYQWRNLDSDEELIMFTTDLALVYDDDYESIVNEFANDLEALNEEFSEAWDKLTTNGGEWSENKKCIDFDETDSNEKSKDQRKGKKSAAFVGEMNDLYKNKNYGIDININTVLLGLIFIAIMSFVCLYYHRTKTAQVKKKINYVSDL